MATTLHSPSRRTWLVVQGPRSRGLSLPPPSQQETQAALGKHISTTRLNREMTKRVFLEEKSSRLYYLKK